MQHSDYQHDPWSRLFRTFDTLLKMVFGDETMVRRMENRLAKRHAPVRGVSSDGIDGSGVPDGIIPPTWPEFLAWFDDYAERNLRATVESDDTTCSRTWRPPLRADAGPPPVSGALPEPSGLEFVDPSPGLRLSRVRVGLAARVSSVRQSGCVCLTPAR